MAIPIVFVFSKIGPYFGVGGSRRRRLIYIYIYIYIYIKHAIWMRNKETLAHNMQNYETACYNSSPVQRTHEIMNRTCTPEPMLIASRNNWVHINQITYTWGNHKSKHVLLPVSPETSSCLFLIATLRKTRTRGAKFWKNHGSHVCEDTFLNVFWKSL